MRQFQSCVEVHEAFAYPYEQEKRQTATAVCLCAGYSVEVSKRDSAQEYVKSVKRQDQSWEC